MKTVNDSTRSLGPMFARLCMRGFERGIQIDTAIFRLGYRRAGGGWMDRVMTWVTHSGDGLLYPALALAGIFLPNPGPTLTKALLVGLALDRALYFSIKPMVRRMRPFNRLAGVAQPFEHIDRYSFPSGHTSAATTTAFIASWLFPSCGWVIPAWAAMVGYSRIYLGAHYPLDVFAGLLLGLMNARIALHLTAG